MKKEENKRDVMIVVAVAAMLAPVMINNIRNPDILLSTNKNDNEREEKRKEGRGKIKIGREEEE